MAESPRWQPTLQEFLSEDPFITGRLAIARLTTGEMSAETMLQWLQRARPEALGALLPRIQDLRALGKKPGNGSWQSPKR